MTILKSLRGYRLAVLESVRCFDDEEHRKWEQLESLGALHPIRIHRAPRGYDEFRAWWNGKIQHEREEYQRTLIVVDMYGTNIWKEHLTRIEEEEWEYGIQSGVRFTTLDELINTITTGDPVTDLWGDIIERGEVDAKNRVSLKDSYCERTDGIVKYPIRVLDAPGLQDDFYLNLVDWSSQNVMAVGLESSVYLWCAETSNITELCDLSSTTKVASVSWSEDGKHLAIGTIHGDVQLWDTSTQKLIRTMPGHVGRITSLSWKLSGSENSDSSLLASGSDDRLILLRDPRWGRSHEISLVGHTQTVCGLRWSFDEKSMLASGGNDNKLLVWDVKMSSQPLHTFSDHSTAVKAIAWNPHQRGLLASGGGTTDGCIRFWDSLTGHRINCVETGSRVCNLVFSKTGNELVSTHGYSENQIMVWEYPSLKKMATLTGHTHRVLYLALSPDGRTIVTGAGDEALKFWQLFPAAEQSNIASS